MFCVRRLRAHAGACCSVPAHCESLTDETSRLFLFNMLLSGQQKTVSCNGP